MRRAPLVLIGAAMVIFVASAGLKTGASTDLSCPEAGVAGLQAGVAGLQAGDSSAYLGSESCRECHQAQYASWKKSLHVQMTRPVEEARVLGDFRAGTRFEKYGRSYAMETREGRRFVKISRRAAAPDGLEREEFKVDYTLGARRFQGYLSRLPDGRIYVLPVFWHVETGQWIDYKEITPLPDEVHDFRQIWNVNCFNCHATNLAQNFDTESRTYRTSWTEMGIGCEACHGPGREHVDRMREREKMARTDRPRAAELKILSPRTAPPRQMFDACGYCHGNKTNYFAGFRAGDRYEDYALPFLISQPIPPEDPQGDFWPDGRPNRFNRPQALTASGCFLKGKVTCTSCHVGHAARHDHALKLPPEQNNRLCTQCHEEMDEMDGRNVRALEAHTHHPAASPGSRCVDCHMSDVNWRLLTRRRDHTFAPPVPEMTAAYGVPNACTTCHDDRAPEWAATTMNAWYGAKDRERRGRAMRLADAMYRAGSGDRASLPELAAVLADRSRGVVVRASAADFIGRLAAPDPAAEAGAAALLPLEVANALLTATADREPMVRAVAVRALGFAGERRASPAIAARLRDPVRVVRVAAAAALLALGIARLDGSSGDALARAQDEYAGSLRAFPDSSGNHASLAWLELSRGRDDQADGALATAIALDPSNAQPRLLRGILLARRNRLDEAIREWTAAKKLDPGNPRLDALIAEARRQQKQ